jgi:hypothetical protein
MSKKNSGHIDRESKPTVTCTAASRHACATERNQASTRNAFDPTVAVARAVAEVSTRRVDPLPSFLALAGTCSAPTAISSKVLGTSGMAAPASVDIDSLSAREIKEKLTDAVSFALYAQPCRLTCFLDTSQTCIHQHMILKGNAFAI